MAIRLIEYDALEDEYRTFVMLDKIVRLSKHEKGEITLIHLTTGEVLESTDSLKTLVARINSDE